MKTEAIDTMSGECREGVDDRENVPVLPEKGKYGAETRGIWYQATMGKGEDNCSQFNHSLSSRECPLCQKEQNLHSSIHEFLEHKLRFLLDSPGFSSWGFRILGGIAFKQIHNMADFFLKDFCDNHELQKDVFVCSICRTCMFLQFIEGEQLKRLDSRSESLIERHLTSHGFQNKLCNGMQPSIFIVLPSVCVYVVCNLCLKLHSCMKTWCKHTMKHATKNYTLFHNCLSSWQTKTRFGTDGLFTRAKFSMNISALPTHDLMRYNFSSPWCRICCNSIETHSPFDLLTHRMLILFQQKTPHSNLISKMGFHSKTFPNYVYNSLVGFTEAIIYECQASAPTRENWDIFICSVCARWEVLEYCLGRSFSVDILNGQQRLSVTTHIEAHDKRKCVLVQKPSLLIEIPSGVVKVICSVCYATFISFSDWCCHVTEHLVDKPVLPPPDHCQHRNIERNSTAGVGDRLRSKLEKRTTRGVKADRLFCREPNQNKAWKNVTKEKNECKRQQTMGVTHALTEVNIPTKWTTIPCVRYLKIKGKNISSSILLTLPTIVFNTFYAKGCLVIPVAAKDPVVITKIRELDDVVCLLRDKRDRNTLIFTMTQSLSIETRVTSSNRVMELLNDANCKHLKLRFRSTFYDKNKQQQFFDLCQVTDRDNDSPNHSGQRSVCSVGTPAPPYSVVGVPVVHDMLGLQQDTSGHALLAGQETSGISTLPIRDLDETHLSGDENTIDQHPSTPNNIVKIINPVKLHLIQKPRTRKTLVHSESSPVNDEKNTAETSPRREILYIYKGNEIRPDAFPYDGSGDHFPDINSAVLQTCPSNDASSRMSLSQGLRQLQNTSFEVSSLEPRENSVCNSEPRAWQSVGTGDLPSFELNHMPVTDIKMEKLDSDEEQNVEVVRVRRTRLGVVDNNWNEYDGQGDISAQDNSRKQHKPVFAYTEKVNIDSTNTDVGNDSVDEADELSVCVYKEPEYDSSTDSADEIVNSNSLSNTMCSVRTNHTPDFEMLGISPTSGKHISVTYKKPYRFVKADEASSPKVVVHGTPRNAVLKHFHCQHESADQTIQDPAHGDLTSFQTDNLSRAIFDSPTSIPCILGGRGLKNCTSQPVNIFTNDNDSSDGLKIISAYSLAEDGEITANVEACRVTNNTTKLSDKTTAKKHAPFGSPVVTRGNTVLNTSRYPVLVSTLSSNRVRPLVSPTTEQCSLKLPTDTILIEGKSLASPAAEKCRLELLSDILPLEKNLVSELNNQTSEDDLFRCEICNCVFTSKYLYINHKLLHKIQNTPI